MGEPVEHKDCREFLKRRAADAGTEVDVSAVVSHHPMAGSFTCPHRVTYWMLPTAEQFAAWEREGAE